MSTNRLPIQVPLTDGRGMIDRRWAFILDQIAAAQPPSGSGFVTDGSSSSYGPMTLFQGPDAGKPGLAESASFYYALDTGKIYRESGGSWVLFSEALTGDVTKPVGSQVTTLATVFPSPGTYGDATKTAVLTIDAKGRVTDLWFETITATAAPGGADTSLQFNNGGVLDGAGQIFYNVGTGGLQFTNPSPTREALSPLTTKGDIFVRNATVSTRLPVGEDGTLLKSSSATATGLEWVGPGTYDIPFQYNVVSPFPLITIPADLVVKEVVVYLEVPFDGTGADLTIGDASDNSSLFPADAISVYEDAGWVSTPVLTFAVNTDINLYITPGTATQGSGIITLIIQT